MTKLSENFFVSLSQIRQVLDVKTLQIHLDMKVNFLRFINFSALLSENCFLLLFPLHSHHHNTLTNIGAIYPCFYSRKNKTVVMTAYNRETQVNIIIHFFIVPFIITIISSIGICIIHCKCSCKKERPKYRRPRVNNLR
jgi:hypothetical protein